MRLLLDTHAWLWFYLGDPQLSMPARNAIADPSRIKLVSPASYWELAIKVALKKYILKESYDELIQHAVFDNGFSILAIEPRHTSAVISLPHYHRDPFDRILIAQAMVENIPLVSGDAVFDPYPVQRIW